MEKRARSKKIKFLLIGINTKHIEHIRAFKTNKYITIVGIVNQNSQEIEKLQTEFNDITFYEDYKAGIKETLPDAIFICTPHDAHLEIVKYAMDKGIHIYKEKPFSLNLSDAKEVLEKSNDSKSKLMIVSQRRFHSTYKEAKQLLPKLGKIHLISVEYSFNRKPTGWRMDKLKSGGGVLIDSGYHMIDLLNYFFDLPKEVFCKTNILDTNYLTHDTEDNAIIIYSFADKMIANITFSRSISANEYVKIHGDNGQLHITRKMLKLVDPNDKVVHKVLAKKSWNKAFSDQLSFFVSCVRNNMTSVPSYSDGYKNSLVIEKCYESSLENKVISIDYKS